MISALITIFLVPKIKDLGLKLGLTDQPNSRKQHKHPIVRIGGIAMVTGFLAAIGISLALGLLSFSDSININLISTILIAGICFFLIGLFDDYSGLSPFTRLILQLSISTIVWYQGLKISAIDLSIANQNLSPIGLPDFVSLLITIIWITGVINAINWLDGLDGLAGGVTFIAAISFGIIAFERNALELSLLAVSLAGCSVGFLKYNLKPGNILMGDCGSYFLGFNLGAISILSFPSYNLSSIVDTSSFNILICIIVLGIPIVDMFAVITSRLIHRISPFHPDRRHLHHRLLKVGLKQREVVILLYSSSIFLTSIALFILQLDNSLIYLIISFSLFLLTAIKSISIIHSRNG